jgi:VIT1/CCC1 family predicted Fe2+/Mn2+ transporter
MQHLALDPEAELLELVNIYVERGLPTDLAQKVAETMHEKDALAAHLRDELGQHPHTKARPVQASVASAISFIGGGLFLFGGACPPTPGAKAWSIVAFAMVGLVITGIVSARASGSAILKPTLRVVIGGAIGMAITAGIGHLVHLSGI